MFICIDKKYNKKYWRHKFHEGYKDNTCLIELDEAPPERINEHALHIALQVSLLMDMDLADKIMDTYNDVLNDSEAVQKKCRATAEKYFNINNEAKQVVKILRDVVSST